MSVKMNASSFEADLNKFAIRTELELDTVVRKIALSLYDGITNKTPVDTGRAKGNWNLSVDSMDTSVNPKARGKKRVSLKKGDGNNVIYISNSLPYIGVLEDGHSKQAPHGMVALTLAEVRASLL